MTLGPTFATRVFRYAGIYGLIVMLPMYFLEERLGRDFPPPIAHPEHFYGFVGVVVVWQIAFLVIASDVRRFRPLMPVAVLEKLSFGIAAWVLFAQDRVVPATVAAATVDLLLGALFALSYRAAAREPGPA